MRNDYGSQVLEREGRNHSFFQHHIDLPGKHPGPGFIKHAGIDCGAHSLSSKVSG
jgi:hypothetical protein